MIQIQEAILHFYDAATLSETLSDTPLDLRSGLMVDYLAHHIERGLKDPAASHAKFSQTSAVPERIKTFIKGDESLVDFSKWAAGLFFGELRDLGVEENYHLALARFHTEIGTPYLAILALADKLAYTHQVDAADDGTLSASIAVHRSIMPQPTQRIKGYAFINLEDLGIRLCDIKVKFEKETILLFEEVLLGCLTEPSSRESYRQIRQMTLAVADDYSQDGVEAFTRAKKFLADNATGSDLVDTRTLAEKVFPNSIQMQNSFMGEVSYANLPENLVVEQEFARKQTATHKLVCDGEITLTIPAEWYDDPDRVEIRVENDGTTTITLRGIETMTAK